jgi:hypothetical protein
VTVDYVPGFEERLAHATPLTRYAAFIQDAERRDRNMPISALELRPFSATVRTEASRLRWKHPDEWRNGAALLEDVGRTLRIEPATVPDRP